MASLRINEAALLAVLWICIALSLFFLLPRLIFQFRIEHKWHVADAFVLAAWLLSLANTVLWSTLYKDMYIIMKLAMGNIAETPSDIALSQIRYLRGQLASYFLSYIGLWCVKLSFLFFLRKLGQRYRLQRILWWAILVLVVVSIGPVFGMLDYKCELSSIEDTVANCTSAHSVWYERVSLKVTTAMDIISDGAIIILSANVMWRVKLQGRRKLALISISLLTGFIIVIALVRLLVSVDGSGILEPAWLIFWSSIEICVAIVVACLASFWTLFTKHRRQKNHVYRHSFFQNNGNTSMERPILLNSIKGQNEESGSTAPYVEPSRSM